MTLSISYRFLRYLLLVVILCAGFQCSTRRNTLVNRTYHNITAHYNAYFNGYESFKEGTIKIAQLQPDNYSQTLTVFKYGDENYSKSIYPDMDRAILKASKVIQRHEIKESVTKKKPKKKKNSSRKEKKKNKKGVKNEEEIHKNWIDDSYMLIGKANFYKRDFEKALESFEYVSKHYKKYPVKYEALVWMVKTYDEEGKYSAAQALLDMIKDKKNTKDLLKQPRKLLSELAATEADFNIKQGKYGPAVKPLEEAIALTKNKKNKVRYTYILAQLYQQQREYLKASEQFTEVLKLNPSYEMAFNAQINRAKGMSGKDTKGIRKELEKMLNDEKNSDYFDQIYYALAELAQRDGDKKLVMVYLNQSIRASKNNDYQKGLSYLRLGNIYFSQPDYPIAASYFDSASAILKDDFSGYEELLNKKNSIKDIVKYLKIIAFEDSVQKLAGLSEKERGYVIDEIIKKVIDEEQKKKEEQAGISQQGSNANQSIPKTSGSQWYFYNPAALSFGSAEFTRKWGERKSEDNWRRKNKKSIDFSINEDENSEEEKDSALAAMEITGNPKDKNSYLKNIPLTRLQMQQSNEKLLDAYYNLGIVYKELLMDERQSIKTFEELLEKYPGNTYTLSCYYQLYRMHLKEGRTAKANYYKNLILKEFPNSDYAKIIENPDFIKQLEANKNKIESYYDETYRAYLYSQYDLVIERCLQADTLFPKNKLMPKFDYLRALSIGKSRDITQFEKALQEVVQKHPNDEVGVQAEATLALIANHKTNITDTSQNSHQKMEDLFSFSKDATHYFILVVPDSIIDMDKLKSEVSNYNTKFFSLVELSTANMLLDNDIHLIIVKKFKDSDEGINYYKSIRQNAKEIPSLPDGKYKDFIISAENFPVLYKDKQVDNYLAFFQKNYL